GITGHQLVGLFFTAAAFNISLFSTKSSGVQASAGVPPQLLLINPVGTFKSWFRCFAKKYPTALKFFRVLLSQTAQWPLLLSCGVAEVVLGILNNLMFLLLRSVNSSFMPSTPER